MAQIKKILDKQGNDIYLRTHTSAVVDDNGYTAESRLQAMQDEINQKQLAIGSVPSDLIPTKDSTNWVESGGVYDSVFIEEEFFDIDDVEVSVAGTSASSYISITKTSTGFTIKCLATGSSRYAFCTIPNLTIGETYTVSFDYVITNESSASYPYLLTVRPDDTNASSNLAVAILQNLGMSGHVSRTFTPTTHTTVFRMANADIAVVNGEVTISNVSVKTVKSVKSIIEEKTPEWDDVASKVNYLTEKVVFDVTDATAGQTDSSIVTCAIDNSVIKFNATGIRTVGKYGWITWPSSTFTVGKKYKVLFDYEAKIGTNGDGYVGICTTTGDSGYVGGKNLGSGSGSSGFTFTMDSQVCIKVSSASLDGQGNYIYLSNFKVIEYNNKDYRTVPQLDNALAVLTDTIEHNVIPAEATYSNIYNGATIPSLKQFSRIGYKKLMNNASCQGGTACGGYYFQFTNQHASMSVYDLTTNTLHSTINMTAVSADHCNNACFSTIFYDSNDTFPLIYTSGSQTGTYQHVQVWRIQLIEDVFSISKIQEITLPTGTEENVWHWGQAYLDNELGYMWYSTNWGGVAHYFKFAIPTIFDNNDEVISEVTLTEEDSLDRFDTYKNFNQQGGVVRNGILYLLDGVPASGTYTKLYVIDLWGKRLINVIDIYNILGITSEFEGCGIHNNTLIANTNGEGIYAIYF